MAGGTRKPVMRVSGFWDTSALVPLCARQGITPDEEIHHRAHREHRGNTSALLCELCGPCGEPPFYD